MDFSEETFESKDFTDEVLKGHFYDECRFVNCNFDNTHMGYAHFENCVFEHCNLQTVKVTQAKWQEVAFKNCRLSGIDFENISPMLLALSFENCQLTYCVFRELKLKGTPFLNSEVKECDFVESDLSKAYFKGSSLERSSFEQCNLQEADFRGAVNYRFDPWNNQIKKAKFSSPEVLVLLDGFDIKID